VAILLDHDAYAFATDPPIWTPLEDILLSFVGMVEQKRVLAVSICSEFDSPEEPKDGFWEEPIPIFTPWALSNDDDQIVDVTISAWHSLLSAIESRIPGPTDNEYKTYDDEHINLCDLYGHFIKKFLQKARIPNFQFVAPGLRLSLPEELAAQPFKGFVPPPPQNLNLNLPQIPSSGLPQISIPQLPNYNRPQDPNQIRNPWDMAVYEYKWYPFLFLRANKKVPKAEGKYNDYPWENASEFSTGLYLINTKTIEKADGCKLLLPFPINSRAFSKFGDEKGIDDVRKNDGLYQPGESLIIRDDKLRLELLFKNWTSMIENGHWEVDENGVVGGIEKFREADTEEKWNLYWIERTW
jgi:hypothetical protein